MFEKLDALAPDPILGLMAKFNADSRGEKTDLGVGVFRDAAGQTPVLRCVKKAEAQLLEGETSKAYVGPAGNLLFNQSIAALALGAEHAVLREGRTVFLQTPGGCGALRVAAELLKRADKSTGLWLSDPTWANHHPLLGDAGLQLNNYRYYDYDQHCIRFDAMLEDLQKAEAGDVVVLHACCHNPCGADLDRAQWQAIANLLSEKQCLPLVDMAYLGFGDGLEEDAYGLRLLADQLPEVLLAISCSKNFGLYRERVGAVGLIGENPTICAASASHLASIVRGIYSMPPSHGASIVANILNDTELRKEWECELQGMRERIQNLRKELVAGMQAAGAGTRFNFIAEEKGMFSFLGIDEPRVERLAKEYGIYMVGSSRINVAGLNSNNMTGFCEALASVL